MIKETAVKDVNGKRFVVNELYGTFTLRELDGRLIAFSDNVEHMLGTILGWHAVSSYKDANRYDSLFDPIREYTTNVHD